MKKVFVGIDEVGRGSLAGPITVAAFYLPPDFLSSIKNAGPLRDSKKLNPKSREKWFKIIKDSIGVKYALGWVTSKVIDRINIRKAANLASRRACLRLIKKNNLSAENLKVIVDGGLFLGDDIPHQTIIRGDEKFAAIKLASIVAKVSRDKAMVRRHKLFPKYNFLKHKGYGTYEHCEALRKYGPSVIHRKSFIKNLRLAKA